MKLCPAGSAGRNMTRICVSLSLCIAITGCSTAISLRTPLEQPCHVSNAARAPSPIRVVYDPEHKAVADAVESYLRTSPNWSLSERKDARPGYLLEWKVVSEKFHSDLATKRATIVYFCCWIITAPIGVIYANVSSWHAKDFLEIQMTLKDSRGRLVYTRSETLTTSETDKTLPDTDSLKDAMRGMTASNLVTLMLNRMEKVMLNAEEKHEP